VRWLCAAPNPTLRVVLDTCVLKLATLPSALNPAALIVEFLFADEVECWASPAMIEEYVEVLNGEPDLLTRILDDVQLCHPLTELAVIRHKPDNRFLECALAVEADYLITVNTARGHFDQKNYQTTRVSSRPANS
jgi:putative PIN family toxin of toxin-antitoxin system